MGRLIEPLIAEVAGKLRAAAAAGAGGGGAALPAAAAGVGGGGAALPAAGGAAGGAHGLGLYPFLSSTTVCVTCHMPCIALLNKASPQCTVHVTVGF